MVYTLMTQGPIGEGLAEAGGGPGGGMHTNNFVHGGHPIDFTDGACRTRRDTLTTGTLAVASCVVPRPGRLCIG